MIDNVDDDEGVMDFIVGGYEVIKSFNFNEVSITSEDEVNNEEQTYEDYDRAMSIL